MPLEVELSPHELLHVQIIFLDGRYLFSSNIFSYLRILRLENKVCINFNPLHIMQMQFRLTVLMSLRSLVLHTLQNSYTLEVYSLLVQFRKFSFVCQDKRQIGLVQLLG